MKPVLVFASLRKKRIEVPTTETSTVLQSLQNSLNPSERCLVLNRMWQAAFVVAGNHKCGTYLHVSKSFSPVLHKQLLDHVLGHWVDMPRPLHTPVEDLLIYAEWIVVVKRGVANQHFIYQYT